jgi:FkbM family methyltransferase
MAWWSERAIVAQLPFLQRLYASYLRLARALSLTRGEYFLFRLVVHVHTRVLRRSPSCRLEIADAVVHLDVTDRRMFLVLDELRLDTPERDVVEALLGPGDTFIDVGANHGSFSLIAARRVGQCGFVAAFEPQPLLAPLLRASLAETKRANYEVYEIACSDHDGVVDLYIPFRPDDGSGRAGIYSDYSARPGGTSVAVRVSTVDACLKQKELPGRVMIKVDVEGSEVEALRGAQGVIERHRPAILVELNAQAAAAADTTPEALLDQLQAFGYTAFAELEEYPKTRPRGELIHLSQRRNVLALHGQT